MAYLRSLRDGRDPIAAAKATGPLDMRNQTASTGEPAKAIDDVMLHASGSLSNRDVSVYVCAICVYVCMYVCSMPRAR